VFNIERLRQRAARPRAYAQVLLGEPRRWENDLHSTGMGGDDDAWSDNVDAFFHSTHGHHDSGHALLAYDIDIN